MEIKAKLLKPYTLSDRNNFIVEYAHKKDYEIEETDNALLAWGEDEEELLEKAKKEKIFQNDILRDKALNKGVIYKDVLFDSDTDQKVNLLAIVTTMTDDDTIVWFGEDNQALECNKEDLINIGKLITVLHTACWTKNTQVKEEINAAQSIEELEGIKIEY